MANSSNKTIAKNTIFLYFRMVFTMVITLYTSRVILEALGIEDYGLYQAVGGIVGMLSFINGALSGGASRFLTFELGRGNNKQLEKTFSTTLLIHIALAIFLFIICETIGLWFLHSKIVIPEGRLYAAQCVFHISIFTASVNLLSVPFNASIISHEKMKIYAYISIFECIAKLLIIYLLNIGSIDKLILYTILILLVQLGIMIFYVIYCKKNFNEINFKPIWEKSIFNKILKFSGWSLIAQGSIALKNQGIIILLNMFFDSSIVAARSISIQVNMAATQLVSNFRTAVNPQIIKKYAAEDYNGSKELLLTSTTFSYFLMLLICLPLYLLAAPVLNLWLVEVPNYSVAFLQLILIQSLFQVFDTSLYTALYAKGQLKENALLSPTIGIITFIIIYFLFKCGYSAIILSWAMIVSYAVLGLVIKPILLIKIVNYTWADIWSTFKPCLLVSITTIPIPYIFSLFIDNTNIWHCIFLILICIINILISVWFLGIKKHIRDIIKNKINSHFK